jgi:hypothetical protein
MECGARFMGGVVNQFVWDSSTTAAVCDEVRVEILRCGAERKGVGSLRSG